MISHVKIVILTRFVEIRRLKVKYNVNLWIKDTYSRDKVLCLAVSFKKRFYCIYIYILINATALGSLIRPRSVTRCNLAVSDMYMRDFGKTHQIAYTYCSVGISDLKPLTGTSADQLPHRKSRSLATA